MPSNTPPPLFIEMRKRIFELCHLGIHILVGEVVARADWALRGVRGKTFNVARKADSYKSCSNKNKMYKKNNKKQLLQLNELKYYCATQCS